MEVLDSDESSARVEFWVDAVLKEVHYVLYRDYEEQEYRLTWRRVSGDMKDIHGSWQTLDTPDPKGKLLIYESFVDINFSVVTWTIRFGAKKWLTGFSSGNSGGTYISWHTLEGNVT